MQSGSMPRSEAIPKPLVSSHVILLAGSRARVHRSGVYLGVCPRLTSGSGPLVPFLLS